MSPVRHAATSGPPRTPTDRHINQSVAGMSGIETSVRVGTSTTTEGTHSLAENEQANENVNEVWEIV